jgi:hypothetical protein
MNERTNGEFNDNPYAVKILSHASRKRRAELSLTMDKDIIRTIKSKRMRWAEHVARLWERRGVYRVLVGNPERKRPLGRPRFRFEDNIKVDLTSLVV